MRSLRFRECGQVSALWDTGVHGMGESRYGPAQAHCARGHHPSLGLVAGSNARLGEQSRVTTGRLERGSQDAADAEWRQLQCRALFSELCRRPLLHCRRRIPSGHELRDFPGEPPVILHFDGRAWSLMRPPTVTEADLEGVDCLSTKYCVAVGSSINAQEYASPLIEEMHGNVWSVTPSPSPNIYPTNSSQLQALSCVAIEECTAVGTDNGVGYPRGIDATTGIVEQETPTGWNLVQLAPFVPTAEPSAAGGTVSPPPLSTRRCLYPFRAPPRCV